MEIVGLLYSGRRFQASSFRNSLGAYLVVGMFVTLADSQQDDFTPCVIQIIEKTVVPYSETILSKTTKDRNFTLQKLEGFAKRSRVVSKPTERL